MVIGMPQVEMAANDEAATVGRDKAGRLIQQPGEGTGKFSGSGWSGLEIGLETGKNPNRLQGRRPMGDNGLVASHGIMRI